MRKLLNWRNMVAMLAVIIAAGSIIWAVRTDAQAQTETAMDTSALSMQTIPGPNGTPIPIPTPDATPVLPVVRVKEAETDNFRCVVVTSDDVLKDLQCFPKE